MGVALAVVAVRLFKSGRAWRTGFSAKPRITPDRFGTGGAVKAQNRRFPEGGSF